MTRLLADAWALAQEQISRIPSADSRMRDMPLRCIAAQIGVEAHLNDRTVQTKMHDAWILVTQFANTVAALEQGRITKGHADVIADIGGVLSDDEVRAAFEEVVLEWASSETIGRTRAYARQLAEKLNPRSMLERHADESADRSVTIADLDNGMSQIIALVPTIYAHGVFDRLTRQAKAVKKADLAARRAAQKRRARAAATTDTPYDRGNRPEPPHSDRSDDEPDDFDERTLHQTRADLLLDMLLTGAPSIDPTADDSDDGLLAVIRPQVQITMPITTVTGVTQGGAEIDGKAPIDPVAARKLAGAARIWDRVMFDPVNATVVAVDRYRQTEAQERLLRARDRRCRFPGCLTPARQCQVDHNHERHEGGETSLCNLACLCGRHHPVKTETAWTAKQLAGGRLEWTSPTGRTYIDEPPRVVFVPDLEPAPF